MNYLLNIANIVRDMIKVSLRKPKRIALLQTALKPLSTINQEFKSKTDDITYFLQFNGQTIYLEHYLNDQYDDVLQRIYIENTSGSNRVTLYFKSEGQASTFVYFKSEAQPPLYLRWKSEPVTGVDFIVWVPVDVTFDEIVMRAQIDKYRQAGKTYLIQTF